MNPDTYLLVVSGPSGAGKDTIVKKICEKYPEVEISVSATTRTPREQEFHGKDYYFLTQEEFQQKIEAGEMLEYVQYCGNYYGTLKSEVDRRLSQQQKMILNIEVIGAKNMKKQYPGALMVFIKPPNLEELARRLRARGTETEEAILKRMTRAKEELQYENQYDCVVINDCLDECVEKICELWQKKINA